MFSSSASSDGAEGSEIYDSNMGGSPTRVVLPAKRISFWIGYGLTSAKSLTVEVTPTSDHESAVFTG
ncbi:MULTISPECIES: hypothetical protein [Mumia]|uniref:hypothetical protein n=1 Tax=Mumia TaxID=1546255 RepID=UPI00141FBBAE|nr:hypothetical protein [Mumia sp. ZJ1417]QMW66746.1 hypothetical protein H4N58_01910 [Mumia sp. ZJ1417]